MIDFKTNSRYREARARSFAASYQAKDTRRQVSRDVESNWVTYQSLKKQKAALYRQSKAMKRTIAGIKSQIEVGLLPINDLLREEIRLTENKIAIIRLELSQQAAAFQIVV